MPGRHRSLVITVVSAVVLAALTALAAGLAAQEAEPGRGYPSTDWPFTGGNWSSSRYSTLDEIDADTLDRLGAAWVAPLPGGAASRSTPVVQDGAIYLTGGANVFAFDARTGETIWHWQPDPAAGRVVSWQGVVVAGDLVVFGTRSGEVLALGRDSGELVWATRVGSPEQTRGEVVTTAPMYARGKVFVGLANGDIGGQGRVLALDAATGEVEWIFYVVPRPGEFGHETWPQDSDSWEYGGGGVWLVGTVDPDLGMVYFSTGNPVPMFGGELREGDNLFTASVLALDMETGERRWHYQVVRHDVWDADIATPLLLYDTTVDGEPVKALAAMRADGYLFLFNRETGEHLLPVEEREVPQDPHQLTVPTQPFPVQTETILFECSYWRDRVPPPFELSCSSYTPPSVDEQTVVAPGLPIPRVRVTPMAFSPQTGYIYAQGRAHVGRARRFEDPFVWNTSQFHLTLPDAVGILAAVDPPHRPGGVAEGDAERVPRRQRSPRDRGRPAVPRLARRTGGGLRCPHRRPPLGLPHERGGGRGCVPARPRPTSWTARSTSPFRWGPRSGRSRSTATCRPAASRPRIRRWTTSPPVPPRARPTRSRPRPCSRTRAVRSAAGAMRSTSTTSTRSARGSARARESGSPTTARSPTPRPRATEAGAPAR